MGPTSSTHAATVFDLAHRACERGERMIPRSSSDKEYFAQDWFQARLAETGLQWTLSGRNSYPDFWLDPPGLNEGYEVKSLAITPQGRPARKDFDANSTIPSGEKGGAPIFLAFFLYLGTGDEPRAVHSFVLAHGDLFNDDRDLTHANHPVTGFGSYGDAFIRDRKMYVLPTPFTIYPAAFGRRVLIIPSEWQLADPTLFHVDRIDRSVAEDRLVEYSVHLYDRTVTPVLQPNPRGGQLRSFDVFEHVQAQQPWPSRSARG